MPYKEPAYAADIKAAHDERKRLFTKSQLDEHKRYMARSRSAVLRKLNAGGKLGDEKLPLISECPYDYLMNATDRRKFVSFGQPDKKYETMVLKGSPNTDEGPSPQLDAMVDYGILLPDQSVYKGLIGIPIDTGSDRGVITSAEFQVMCHGKTYTAFSKDHDLPEVVQWRRGCIDPTTLTNNESKKSAPWAAIQQYTTMPCYERFDSQGQILAKPQLMISIDGATPNLETTSSSAATRLCQSKSDGLHFKQFGPAVYTREMMGVYLAIMLAGEENQAIYGDQYRMTKICIMPNAYLKALCPQDQELARRASVEAFIAALSIAEKVVQRPMTDCFLCAGSWAEDNNNKRLFEQIAAAYDLRSECVCTPAFSGTIKDVLSKEEQKSGKNRQVVPCMPNMASLNHPGGGCYGEGALSALEEATARNTLTTNIQCNPIKNVYSPLHDAKSYEKAQKEGRVCQFPIPIMREPNVSSDFICRRVGEPITLDPDLQALMKNPTTGEVLKCMQMSDSYIDCMRSQWRSEVILRLQDIESKKQKINSKYPELLVHLPKSYSADQFKNSLGAPLHKEVKSAEEVKSQPTRQKRIRSLLKKDTTQLTSSATKFPPLVVPQLQVDEREEPDYTPVPPSDNTPAGLQPNKPGTIDDGTLKDAKAKVKDEKEEKKIEADTKQDKAGAALTTTPNNETPALSTAQSDQSEDESANVVKRPTSWKDVNSLASFFVVLLYRFWLFVEKFKNLFSSSNSKHRGCVEDSNPEVQIDIHATAAARENTTSLQEVQSTPVHTEHNTDRRIE